MPMKWISCIATLLALVATSARIEAAVFSNPTSINLPSSGTTATPFPSTNFVSGMVGTITKVTVTLNNINHPRPDDLEILLVGPTGKKFVLLADAGGTATPASGVTLTFDDAAASLVADAGPMATGTFKPTCVDAQANINTEFPGVAGPFDVPAPSGSGTLALSFNGTNPNGNWNLYVVDDIEGTPSGSITGGWTLNITTGSTTEPSVTTVASSVNPSKVGSNVTFTATVRRTNNAAITTGGVIFKEGAAVLQGSNGVNGAGQVTFTTSALTEGIHIITAEYTGNASFFGSSATVTQIVDNATAVSGNTFANPGAITVGDTANVYPSHIFVTNLPGTISKVTMLLSNITYTRPDDLELLLVSPSGAQFIVLADAGGTASGMTGVTLTFDDGAPSLIPDSSAPSTGFYRPTDYNSTAAVFPPPAPSGPYNHPAPGGGSTFANIFNGLNPNGTWSLYVVDDVPGTGGTIAGGWALTFLLSSDAPTITTVTSSPNPSITGQSVTFTAAVVRASNSVPVTNGTVTFREGAVVLAAGVPLNTNGLATFATSLLTEGNHVISADYNGFLGFFNVSSGSTTQRVDNATIVTGNRYANPGPLFVPASATVASVYPSRVIVTGLPPAVCHVSVLLNNINTDRPDDLEFLLVSPTGAQLILMSDAGGVDPASGVTLTLSDAASFMIASNGPLISGTFKPISVNSTPANFPAPAPAPPYNHPAPFGSATLDGTFTGNPNGYWSLYMVDDVPGALAAVSNGWSLIFNYVQVATVGPTQSICTSGTTLPLGGNTPVSGTGVWSVVSGGTGFFSPNATVPNATFTHTGGAGPITLRWTITEPGCGFTFADVQVNIPCVNTLAGRVAVFGAPSDTNWNADVRAKIIAGGMFQQVDVFYAGAGAPVPTLAQLLQYQSVLVYSDAPFSDNTAFGNALADYVDAGGGVVVATFAFWEAAGGGLAMNGRLLTGNYLPFTTGQQNFTANLSLVKDLPAHPILNGVNSLTGNPSVYYNTPLAVANGAALVAHWNNGQPLIAARQSPNGGRVAGLNFYPPSSTAFPSGGWLATTDGGRIMANALLWAGTPAILSGPSNLTVYVGTPVTFNVVGSGNPRDFQWRKNGSPIPGAIGTNLNFIATFADAGQYSVVVSNALGTNVSAGATLTVLPAVQLAANAVDTGWYNNLGVHNPNNSNYIAGNSFDTYRDFFVFNIPVLPGPLSKVELRILTYNVFSTNGNETYQLRHVSTAIPTLRAGGTVPATYVDLGDGPVYGTRTFFTTDTNRFFSFPLNQTLRSAVAAASGGQFAMGGEIISLDGFTNSSEYVFGGSQGLPGDVQLLLTVGGAPTVGYFTDFNPDSDGPLGPILAAGYIPLKITNITSQSLADLRILFLDESSNGALTPALLARLPDIRNWVRAGGRLIVHDRSAGNLQPNQFLFGLTSTNTVRLAVDDVSIIQPATTLVTAGPFGVVDNGTLDNGCNSVHGFVNVSNMPAGARAILSTGTSSNEVVALSYQWGAGFVYYSTIPLDYYLDDGDCGNGTNLIMNLQQIYTPNVLTYVHSLNSPLEFLRPSLNASNALPLFIRNVDNSALSADRVAQIKVYSASNIVAPLTNWTLLSNSKVLTNGLLRIDGIRATNSTPAFYRAVETP